MRHLPELQSLPPAYAVHRCPDLNKLAMMSTAPFQLYVWPQHLLMLGPAYAPRLNIVTTPRKLRWD
jgi:hypothetical protein